MSPGDRGAGVGDNSHCDPDTLATLYPACLGCRKQIDSLLASIDKNGVSYSGRGCSTSTSPGALARPWGTRSRGNDGCVTSRLIPRGACSSDGCNTSSPGWSSGISTADNPYDGSGTVATQQRLLGLSQQLSRDVVRMCDAFERERSQLPPQQALLWQRRITGLRDDAASLASAVQAEVGSMQSWDQDEHRQREELLQLRGGNWGRSRYKSNNRDTKASVVEEAERAAATQWNKQRREEQRNDLAWLREREKLQESSMMLETLFAQGRGALDRVVQQNSVLRGAKRKLMKLTSAAGVSSTLIRAAARRQASDRKLICGGMLLTLVFFFFLYRFARTYSFSSLFLMRSPSSAGVGTLDASVGSISYAMQRL